MPSMETSSTSSSVSVSSGSPAGAGFSAISMVATRSLMALSLATQTWTMNAAAPFPSRGDEYIPHVNVTLCHKTRLVEEADRVDRHGINQRGGGGGRRAAWPASRHQPAGAGADRPAPVHRA